MSTILIKVGIVEANENRHLCESDPAMDLLKWAGTGRAQCPAMDIFQVQLCHELKDSDESP